MSKDGLKRKLAAILSADVEGYSRLMGDDEVGTIDTLTAYKEAMASLIRQYSGRVVDAPGDNLLAEFASAVDAVQCAVEIRRELAVRNEDRFEDCKMYFRIGVNVGDVIDKEGRIYGDGVNIAARVEGLADAGGICISGRVYDQVENKLDLAYEFLGEQKVKNITRPVRIYRVLSDSGAAVDRVVQVKEAAGRRRKMALAILAVVVVGAVAVAGWQYYQGQSKKVRPASVEKMAFPLPDKPSIAVLPFDNLSDDPKQEYFCDGMTEDLITDLSKISGMLVIARNSTFVYKGKPVKIRQVAEELGVRYVLEGSVRKAENKVRITAQLIDAISGHHIWADRYDGNLKDVFALQDKVTSSIVTALAVQLTAGDEERVAHKGTANAHAYDVFLRGWEHYLRQTPDDFRKAISYFEKAVDLDPQYTRAYAALAATYWETWKRLWHEKIGLDLTAHWHEPRFRAEQFLAKAMQDPTQLAHQVSSAKLLHLQQHEEAIAEAQRAITLDPNDADSYVSLASALSLAGRTDEALGWVERAMRLNPHYPSYYLYQLGLIQFCMEQFDKALVSLEKATALNPDDRWSYRLLLATYGQLGRSEDAAKALWAIKERDKRGWQNSIDPLTVRSSAFWLPFKEPVDAERLAQGLRNAGIPD